MTRYDYEANIPPGYYDNIFHEGSGVRYWWHFLKFYAVKAATPDIDSWLDVGCGPGTMLGNFVTCNKSMGIDFSSPQIEYANKKYGSPSRKFSTSSVEELISKGEKFDVISLVEVIEHLPPEDADSLINQLYELLNDNGYLIVTTPNYRSLWPLIELGVNFLSHVNYEDQHINKYNPSRLHQQLDALFDTEISTIVGFAPFFAVISDKLVSLVNALEQKVGYLGIGNLILAIARPKSN